MARIEKKCPSCFILHTPDHCPGEVKTKALEKKCPSCFISHTPAACPTVAVQMHPRCLFRGENLLAVPATKSGEGDKPLAVAHDLGKASPRSPFQEAVRERVKAGGEPWKP